VSDPQASASTTLPANPSLRHLKDQARDLLRSGQALTLSEALFYVARGYGYKSWPRLKSYVDSLGVIGELRSAIDSNDLPTIKRLMTRFPDLHQAPMGYANNGPLTWVAECRVPRVPPDQTRLAMAAWMIENGSDVHQGGDGPLMRAALDDMRIPMMELLVRYGADVNALWNGSYPIICAPCETLAPQSLRWLMAHGADPRLVSKDYGTPLSMVVGTYSRNARGKHACLEAFEEAGFLLPDTPVMALHRGRLDLLGSHLDRDPSLLSKQFSAVEIFPAEVGVDEGSGLTTTPLDGATLLHIAAEMQDLDVAKWLIDRGADVNARAAVDAEGFGGQTPLYHTVVVMGPKTADMARLLLESGADPNVHATFRKQLKDMGDPEKEQMRPFVDVTPVQYARQYQAPEFVNEAAVALMKEYGAVE
jgi:ankyrin repeat protein